MLRPVVLLWILLLSILAAMAAKSLLVQLPNVRPASSPGEFSADRAATRLADVLGKGADVGPLGAGDVDRPAIALPGRDCDGVDRDAARLALDLDAGSGVIVEGLALVLERGVNEDVKVTAVSSFTPARICSVVRKRSLRRRWSLSSAAALHRASPVSAEYLCAMPRTSATT